MVKKGIFISEVLVLIPWPSDLIYRPWMQCRICNTVRVLSSSSGGIDGPYSEA